MSVTAADYSPEDLLVKMSQSFREQNYYGSFSFQRGNSSQSFRIAHAVIDGKEFERLEYMDGEERDIVLRGDELDCIQTGQHQIRFSRQQSLRFSALTKKGIEAFYQLSVTGNDRVAGRQTINIAVSPKDTHRYGYQLSLDEETGLLLRTVLLGPKNVVLERFQFVDITIGKTVAADYFQAPYPTDQPKISANLPLKQVPGEVADLQWVVKWLPAGFTSVIADTAVIRGDMVTFTDGLAVFSVFLEQDELTSDAQVGPDGSAQRGATTAYSKVLLMAGNPHRVTVVGEIPEQTAQKIARSVLIATEIH